MTKKQTEQLDAKLDRVLTTLEGLRARIDYVLEDLRDYRKREYQDDAEQTTNCPEWLR